MMIKSEESLFQGPLYLLHDIRHLSRDIRLVFLEIFLEHSHKSGCRLIVFFLVSPGVAGIKYLSGHSGADCGDIKPEESVLSKTPAFSVPFKRN